jgi:cytochrome c556
MHIGFGRVIAAAVVVVGLAAGTAQAQERMVEGEMVGEAVKYRVNIMLAIGAHMGSVGAILQGKVSNKGNLAAHGAAIGGLAGMFGDLFSKGSDAGSRLKTVFFDDKEQVAGIIAALEAAGQKMATAAAAGDTAGVGQNLGAMGQQCGACHNQYRALQS